MDADILLILLQDGVVNGAIYALLALSLVLVFAVTRVILIPQGEFVAFGALTYAALDAGQVPGSLWLLAGLGVAAFGAGLMPGRGDRDDPAGWSRLAVETPARAGRGRGADAGCWPPGSPASRSRRC